MPAEQRSSLPVVGPNLENSLFKRPRGQGVEDGVQSTVDGENENDHPGTDGTCREMDSELEYKNRLKITVLVLLYETFCMKLSSNREPISTS